MDLNIRARLAEICRRSSPLSAAIKVDQSYFAAQRVRDGRRKTIGLLKQERNFYTENILDHSKLTLQGIIRQKTPSESVIHYDSWHGYKGLVLAMINILAFIIVLMNLS